jgi:cytochrome b subunit of formate dehydrogenase
MTDTTSRKYQRFNVLQRVEHLLMLVSFTVLAVTGLPQKFATTNWGEGLIELMGGIEPVRIIHRVSAIVMILASIVYLVDVAYRLLVMRDRPYMLPTLSDALDAWNAFLYNLGIRKENPRIGRFGFEEKAEFWAFVWGTALMALTGFMMWNPVTTARFLPGEFIPAAKAAHGAEALLAVLAVALWHFYGVHIKHFNLSMWTGDLTEEEMAEFHPKELDDIEAGRVPPKPDLETARKRQRIFVPVASVLVLALVIGVYLFATYEETAITTVPRQDIVVFVPPTPAPIVIPPTSAPIAGGEEADATWAGLQPLFEDKCGGCHGSTAGLTLTDYDSVIAGGDSGLAVAPGDSAGSLLVEVQEAGHMGQFEDTELDLVRQWIDDGASGE